MAREEQDREDLMREATALVERIEFRVEAKSVVVGFRRTGAGSIFFEADPAYHFNGAGELRRAFVDEVLYKSEGGRLIGLRRERTASEVALVSHALPATEAVRFLSDLQERLESLRTAIDDHCATVVSQIPAEGLLTDRVTRWLATLDKPIRIADSPRV
jgi:hypothetical protein